MIRPKKNAKKVVASPEQSEAKIDFAALRLQADRAFKKGGDGCGRRE